MLTHALIRHDKDSLLSGIRRISMIVRKFRQASLFFGKRREFSTTITPELEACDIPEGFNERTPIFVVLRGLSFYFKGKALPSLVLCPDEYLVCFLIFKIFQYGGFGTGSHCSGRNMV
jgi:hypothetical protein